MPGSTEQAVLETVGGYRGSKANTTARVHSAATTNLTSVTTKPCTLGMIEVYNLAATKRFLKFYDKASAPVLAVDVPIWTIPLAADGGYDKLPKPLNFANGLAYAIVANVADTDATAIGAAEVTGILGYAP